MCDVVQVNYDQCEENRVPVLEVKKLIQIQNEEVGGFQSFHYTHLQLRYKHSSACYQLVVWGSALSSASPLIAGVVNLRPDIVAAVLDDYVEEANCISLQLASLFVHDFTH